MYCYGNTLLPNNNITLIAAQRPFKYVVRDTHIGWTMCCHKRYFRDVGVEGFVGFRFRNDQFEEKETGVVIAYTEGSGT